MYILSGQFFTFPFILLLSGSFSVEYFYQKKVYLYCFDDKNKN